MGRIQSVKSKNKVTFQMGADYIGSPFYPDNQQVPREKWRKWGWVGVGLVAWICFVVAHFERMSFEHVQGFGRQPVLSESCCFLKMSNVGSDGDDPF